MTLNSKVAGVTTQELEPSLRTLVRREILTQASDPRSPERGQYVFVQALIREVAYNTLAYRDRRGRHLAAARYFEALGSDELAGALAGHLLAAVGYSAPGLEADAVSGQARLALVGAAERATALGSHDQAVTYLEQALTVTTDPAGEADLRERAGRSASNAGQHDRAEAFLRRALEVRQGLGDRAAELASAASLGAVLLFGYRVEVAVDLLAGAMGKVDTLDGDEGAIRLAAQLAKGLGMSAELGRAVDLADRVLVAAEHADMTAVVADTLVTKGAALADLGRSYEGIGAMQAGLDLARSERLPTTVMRALNNLAVTQIPRDPVAALDAARLGLDEARRLSLSNWITNLVANGIEAAHWTGAWAWAIEEGRSLLAGELDRIDRAFLLTAVLPIRSWRGELVDREINEVSDLIVGFEDPDILSTVHAARAHRAFASGRLDEARQESQERGRLSPANTASGYTLAARSALWNGDLEAVIADLRSLEATHAHGPAITLHKATIRAGIAALERRSADALAAYRDALRGWRDTGLPVLEAMTAIDMATLLDPSLPEVQAAATKARQILTDVGARPFLERLESALADGPIPSAAKVSSGSIREPA